MYENKFILNEKFLMLYEILKKEGAFKTAKNFCDLIGLNPQSLTEIKANRQLVTSEIIFKFLKTFSQFTANDLFIENIYENNELIPTIKHSDIIKGIPLIPVEAMAGYANGDTQVMDYEIVDNYKIPEFIAKGVKYLIRVSGSSMYPKYSNGDLLACKPIVDQSYLEWGKVYVLDTLNGPIVKRLFPSKDKEDHIECRSDNHTNYPPFLIPKNSIRKLSIVTGVIRME